MAAEGAACRPQGKILESDWLEMRIQLHGMQQKHILLQLTWDVQWTFLWLWSCIGKCSSKLRICKTLPRTGRLVPRTLDFYEQSPLLFVFVTQEYISNFHLVCCTEVQKSLTNVRQVYCAVSVHEFFPTVPDSNDKMTKISLRHHNEDNSMHTK